MIIAHQSREQEYTDKGFVVVARSDERILIVDPKRTCCHPVRGSGGRLCTLDKGHRGYHSAHTFNCDYCGKERRKPAAYQDENISICFLCKLDEDSSGRWY